MTRPYHARAGRSSGFGGYGGSMAEAFSPQISGGGSPRARGCRVSETGREATEWMGVGVRGGADGCQCQLVRAENTKGLGCARMHMRVCAIAQFFVLSFRLGSPIFNSSEPGRRPHARSQADARSYLYRRQWRTSRGFCAQEKSAAVYCHMRQKRFCMAVS